MRLSRLLPVLVAGALLTATVTPASAATPGVGTTYGSLTVLGLDAGELLELRLLSDEGAANTDPGAGDPIAAAVLSALSVASATLGVDEQLPLVQVTSTDGEQAASQELTTIPSNLVVGGQVLPVDLRALVGADGAASSIGAGIADLQVLSGILGLTSTSLDLGAASLTESADGSRTISIDGITVLDLGALLAGLGIPLEDLSLDTLLALVDSLGLLPELGAQLDALGLTNTLADLGLPALDLTALTAEGVAGAVADLLTASTALETVGPTLNQGCDVLSPVVGGVGGIIGQAPADVCADVGGAVEDVTSLIGDVDGLIRGLLDTVLGVLDGQALVSVDGLEVGVITKATDSLDTSIADVSAVLGGITVGALGLGPVDLLGPAGQVTALVDQVQGTVGGILGQVDPSLADLVSISLLEETTSVAERDGVIVSDASFTGLGIDIAALDISDLVDRLAAGTSIGEQLQSLGAPAPAPLPISALNDQLAAAVGSTSRVSVLSDGLSMQVASLSQQSAFAPVASPANPVTGSTPTLPTTGGNGTVLLLGAAIAAVGALGIRRVIRIR